MTAADEIDHVLKSGGLTREDIMAAEIYLVGYRYTKVTGHPTPNDSRYEEVAYATLQVNGDVDAFMDRMQFEYDPSYGSQEVFGTIWLRDGRWCCRGEYDGSEWWDLVTPPPIPAYLVDSTVNSLANQE